MSGGRGSRMLDLQQDNLHRISFQSGKPVNVVRTTFSNTCVCLCVFVLYTMRRERDQMIMMMMEYGGKINYVLLFRTHNIFLSFYGVAFSFLSTHKMFLPLQNIRKNMRWGKKCGVSKPLGFKQQLLCLGQIFRYILNSQRQVHQKLNLTILNTHSSVT